MKTKKKGAESHRKDLTYCSKPNSKLSEGVTCKDLQRQNHSCVACRLKLTSEERVHLHHKDEIHDNWQWSNLVTGHESCQDYLHMSKGESVRTSKDGRSENFTPKVKREG